ncbi:hypothetical protein QBC45DRAFT_339561, partial [Copromyces sp. CBS 386.78]
LIEQVNKRRKTISAKILTITIINYNLIIKVAIKRIYLKARFQLYIFYINKSVILNIKRK